MWWSASAASFPCFLTVAFNGSAIKRGGMQWAVSQVGLGLVAHYGQCKSWHSALVVRVMQLLGSACRFCCLSKQRLQSSGKSHSRAMHLCAVG